MQILREIFSRVDVFNFNDELFALRLVCKVWNEVFVSMSIPKIRLYVQPKWEDDGICDATPFLALCINMTPKLARSLVLNQAEFFKREQTMAFTSTMIHVFDKFTDYVQHLEVTIEPSLIPLLHQMMSNFCPNLKTMIFEPINKSKAGGTSLEEVILPALPLTTNLTKFSINAECGFIPTQFQAFAQLVINSAPNLTTFETVPHFYPDFSTVKNLKILSINTSLKQLVHNVSASDFKELTRMLDQVSGTLENFLIDGKYTSSWKTPETVPTAKFLPAAGLASANFKMPPMPKLTTLWNDFTEILRFGNALEDIRPDKMPNLTELSLSKERTKSRSVGHIIRAITANPSCVSFPGIKKLSISNIHHTQPLSGLRTAFPALETLTISRQLESNPMCMLRTIRACVPLQLTHLHLQYLSCPKAVKTLWKCFSSNLIMFKSKI